MSYDNALYKSILHYIIIIIIIIVIVVVKYGIWIVCTEWLSLVSTSASDCLEGLVSKWPIMCRVGC